MPLGFDEPFSIATKALRCALRVAPGEHIRISTRKRHGIEGRKSGSRPSLMSLLLGPVRPIDERCKNLDEEMVATKAEGRGLLRHAGGCTPEFVGEDGATRRDSGLHRLDENVDAPAIERWKPLNSFVDRTSQSQRRGRIQQNSLSTDFASSASVLGSSCE